MKRTDEIDKFTWGLAMVDLLPILIFAGSLSIIAIHYRSMLFIIGGALCVLAGLGKVIWKIILAAGGKDVKFFFFQFRATMPAGFVLMLAGVAEHTESILWTRIAQEICSFPSVLCFVLAIISMIAMFVMASKLDRKNARHNWLEQFTNIFMQTMVFLGVLFVAIGLN